MITEDYVSFEIAKLLKEKGFKGVFSCFYEKGRIIDFNNYWWKITTKERYDSIEAPTLQMAMKWLREVHKIFFSVNYYNIDIGNEWLQLKVNIPNHNGCEISFEGFNLEDQYEAAIKYCLENLL